MTTNYERIKNMTVEEMAEFFSSSKPKCCGFCMGVYMGCLRESDCKSAIKSWLKSDRAPCFLDDKKQKLWLQAESEE